MSNDSCSALEQEAADILSELNYFFIKYRIRVWIDQGTLIDAILEGKVKGITLIDEWARSLKLGFRFQDAVPLLENLNNMSEQDYTIQVHDSTIDLQKGSIKINIKGYQLKSKEEINPLERDSDPFWYVTVINTEDSLVKRKVSSVRSMPHKWIAYGYCIPPYFLDSLDKIDLYGKTWNIPSQIQRYLVYRYGDSWQEYAKDAPDRTIISLTARELKRLKLERLKNLYYNHKLTYVR